MIQSKLRTTDVAYIVDDDPDFTRLLEFVLKKWGIETEVFADPETFQRRLQMRMPKLCLIDLNFGPQERGFELIKAIRSMQLKPGQIQPAIFVASSESTRESMMRALELGANEYLFKPVRRELLISKLLNHFDTQELSHAQWHSPPKVVGEKAAQLHLDLELLGVDESGVRVRSRHLMRRGTVVSLEAPFLAQITQMSAPILVSVSTQWVETESGFYGAKLEFDLSDLDLTRAVRRWLASAAAEPSLP